MSTVLESCVGSPNASSIKIRNSEWKVTWVTEGATVAYKILWKFDNANGVSDPVNWVGTWDFSHSSEDQIILKCKSKELEFTYVMTFISNDFAYVTNNSEIIHLAKRSV